MRETELQDAIGSLPKSIEPPRDLWPSIEARLGRAATGSGASRHPRAWQWPAMAAGVMLALAAGILIGRGMGEAPVEVAPYPVAQFALAGGIETAEREYQAAFRELVPLNYSGLSLETEDPEALRKSWEDLVQAESLLMVALEQYPTNIYLNEKLLDLRSRQLRFVKQLALLEQNDWRRT
ncbi:MAG: hypothetical protein PVF46_02395 [Lysobacterales bacterium]|jgi:hypothetical protein